MLIVYLLLAVFGLLLVLAVAAMVFFKLTVGKRDTWKSPEEHIYGDGTRQALLLYQPSNHRHNVPPIKALAECLAGMGYRVTVNYPSKQLDYDPACYDLLVFGSAVYMGETAKPLTEYLQTHPVTGKKILLFVTGAAEKAPELEALRLLLPDENEICALKFKAKDGQKLLDFAQNSLT
ncbi:MAG: hypothetical protein RRY65_02770 [Pseudoflavonifractor sp.]